MEITVHKVDANAVRAVQANGEDRILIGPEPKNSVGRCGGTQAAWLRQSCKAFIWSSVQETGHVYSLMWSRAPKS